LCGVLWLTIAGANVPSQWLARGFSWGQTQLTALFFVGTGGGLGGSLGTALALTAVILLGVAMTLWVSKLLTKTVLRGTPTAFTMELPPYRTPRFGQVVVRSVLDRTLFVLGRAVVVAAPAGLVIWVCANVTVGNASLLTHAIGFLDPFARLLGLDGVILAAFILGFPANEIVLPIILMGYLATGTLQDMEGAAALGMVAICASRGSWT
ncbi:MAG: nucleoside recognition domain-containing protein, partial [Oscillospiraceae bacterium]